MKLACAVTALLLSALWLLGTHGPAAAIRFEEQLFTARTAHTE